MAKKTVSGEAKEKKSRSKKIDTIGKPDTSVLANYSPTDGAQAHPDWVKKNFPTYVGSHEGHEATAVRQFTHAGHSIKIFTTYRVEVDGQPIRAHLSVDENGQVYTHATPFVTYASAINLMKAVIDAYPESFSAPEEREDDEHQHHTAHDHGSTPGSTT